MEVALAKTECTTVCVVFLREVLKNTRAIRLFITLSDAFTQKKLTCYFLLRRSAGAIGD